MKNDFYTNVQSVGGKILYRGVENGQKVRRKLDYSPVLFVPSQDDVGYRTVTGQLVAPVKFSGVGPAKDYIRKYEGVNNFPIFGQQRFEYCYISDNFSDHINWNADYISIANLDIEVGSDSGFPEPKDALEPVTAITVKQDGLINVFGTGEFTTDRKDIIYNRCADEEDLLRQFCMWWQENYPDIVTGWNIEFFDIPYLINRIVRILGESYAKQMSPWNMIRLEMKEFKKVERETYTINGIAIWDYQHLFQKYTKGGWSHESYTLDAIAFDVLGKKKLSYAEYDNLRRLYRENHQLFIEYNIRDVELVDEIDKKERVIDLCLTMAYDAKVNYEDVFTQVRMWDIIIYNHLKSKKMVIPPMKSNSKSEKYEGAYVKEPITGLHEWVASFDLASLYPHLIMQFNVSPDTLIPPEEYTEGMKEILRKHPISVEYLLGPKDSKLPMRLIEEGVTVTPNAQFFTTKRHGFLAEIMQTMYNDRKMYKNKMIAAETEMQGVEDPIKKKELENLQSKYDNLQRAKKEALNSAYGALGNQWFRFFAIPMAEAITTGGQLVIQWIGNAINGYLNKVLNTTGVDYIIASDTDSVYINLGPLVKFSYGDALANTPRDKVIDFMDEICVQKIRPFIDKTCDDLGNYLNVYEQKMEMKREVLADRGIWTAKKKYLLHVYDSERVRYEVPKLKISGLEAIRSSTPSSCRAKIKDALKIIVTKTENDLIDFIDEFRDEYKSLPLEEIASPRSVRGLEKYASGDNAVFKDGAPYHVKATLFFNREIKKRGLETKYELIKEGEKIKFIALKEPNTFRTPVIAFMNRPPVELELEKYVDYQEQFDKTFISPLKLILDKIGWKTERRNSLMSLIRKK